MKGTTRFVALACVSALVLGACSYDPVDEDETVAAGEVNTNDTLTGMIADSDNLDSVKDLMNDAGLASAFEGNAPYTIFAPTDEALDALGEDFRGEEARPALLAILREHIVPGYLTMDDIAAAIESNGGPVEIQTMGEGTLTLSADGDTITITPTGGEASATLSRTMRGANGVVFPVDAVLKDLEPTG